MKAYCRIRSQPHYRHDCFLRGLEAAGYQARSGDPVGSAQLGDVLVVWNRYGPAEQIADRFEHDGGTVLVAENGYIGPGGASPRDQAHAGGTGGSVYALSRHAHNGRGWWPGCDGKPTKEWAARWPRLGIPPKPLRTSGDTVLIAPNRSFGQRGGVMPDDWAEREASEWRALGWRVRVRPHPGNGAAAVPLDRDLADVGAVAIWSSTVGIHALIEGIPVICKAPWWICKRGAFGSVAEFEACRRKPHMTWWWHTLRKHALQRMAWAQWTVEEIASGEAFRQLLSDPGQGQSVAAV